MVTNNSVLQSLINFLAAPLFCFVGVEIFQSLALLRREYGIVCRNAVDLTLTVNMAVMSVAVELEPKPLSVVMGDGGAENLSMEQIQSAAIDWGLGGIKENIAKLEKEYGFGCKNSFDLRDLAGNVMRQPHLAACGVDELALELNLLKLQKPTSAVFNDWGNNKLHKKQVKLATLNVYAYFETGNKLLVAGNSSS
ncbi:PREDICTED: Werner [Prunus dulcis]|uniref:PREDICTED: Werner n=1 Tax=Prunus dulcis TaxID=3755 RepID=A0A5E4F0E9_PRUDU|nr:hypothetical protein L3X38_015503 [Prunus dulcis]VVA21162.1 PREDICTED: Werner [Prunus dulcis]